MGFVFTPFPPSLSARADRLPRGVGHRCSAPPSRGARRPRVRPWWTCDGRAADCKATSVLPELCQKSW